MWMNDDVWYVILSFCDYSERGRANCVSSGWQALAQLLDWSPICQKYVGVDGNESIVRQWRLRHWSFFKRYACFHRNTISPIRLCGRDVQCWTPWCPVEFCRCDETSLSIHFKSNYNAAHTEFIEWLSPLFNTEFMMWARGPVDIVAKREWGHGDPWALPTTIAHEYTGREQTLQRARLPLEGMVCALVSFRPFFHTFIEPTRIMVMQLRALRVLDRS